MLQAPCIVLIISLKSFLNILLFIDNPNYLIYLKITLELFPQFLNCYAIDTKSICCPSLKVAYSIMPHLASKSRILPSKQWQQ